MIHFAIFLFSLLGSAEARPLEEITKSAVLTVAVDGASPPFNYFKGKDLVGFDVEFILEIAKRMGLQVNWKVQPFGSLIVGVNQDHFDLIGTSHAVTPVRAEVVEFTYPVYCTQATLVSLSNGPKKVSDLSGKVVVTAAGSIYADTLKGKYGIKEIRTVPSETDGFQNLISNHADVWVTENLLAQEIVVSHPQTGLQLGDSISELKNAMVVAKGNTALLAEINRHIRSIYQDGSYSRMSLKYFKTDIRCK